ncbi:MAG: hypothetical protein FWD59_03935 [Micrococcales bacterium]|nr:hypothetical protein [Micrococcales bacterium]
MTETGPSRDIDAPRKREESNDVGACTTTDQSAEAHARRAAHVALYEEFLRGLSPQERKRVEGRFCRDLGIKANRRSAQDLRDLADLAQRVSAEGEDAFFSDTLHGEERRGNALAILHRFATITTEHLPGWWRHAHPEIRDNVDAIRELRNAMHAYHDIEEREIYNEFVRLPHLIATLDLSVLETE